MIVIWIEWLGLSWRVYDSKAAYRKCVPANTKSISFSFVFGAADFKCTYIFYRYFTFETKIEYRKKITMYRRVGLTYTQSVCVCVCGAIVAFILIYAWATWRLYGLRSDSMCMNKKKNTKLSYHRRHLFSLCFTEFFADLIQFSVFVIIVDAVPLILSLNIIRLLVGVWYGQRTKTQQKFYYKYILLHEMPVQHSYMHRAVATRVQLSERSLCFCQQWTDRAVFFSPHVKHRKLQYCVLLGVFFWFIIH